MKVSFVTIGKFKSSHYQELTSHYLKLCSKFATVSHHPLFYSKSAKTPDEVLARFLEKKSRHTLTLLDENGKTWDSIAWAKQIEKIKDSSVSEWIIALSAEHGFNSETKKKALFCWSLSPLTMAHELAAVVASEQLFRGFSILNNHPYHN